MKVSIIGGDFGNNPRPSSIIKIIQNHFDNLLSNDDMLGIFRNGGTLENLPVELDADLNIWMPNIDNENEKQYPKKKKGSVLICSKVMREGYTDIDAISRIFKMGGNAVIAIYPTIGKADKPMYTFKLLDALGNDWYYGSNIEALCGAIKQIYDFTKQSIRIETQQFIPSNNSSEELKDKPSLVEFIEINKSLAEHIQTSCGGRFFGNISTRCQQLFPSSRIGKSSSVFVSPRNSDKGALTPSDMVYAFYDEIVEEKVIYIGNRKPSVDTPTQLRIYDNCSEVNFMIHGHAFIKGAPYTNEYYLCGDVREADEVIEMINRGRFTEKYGCINLLNHGFLIYANDLSGLKEIIKNLEFSYER